MHPEIHHPKNVRTRLTLLHSLSLLNHIRRSSFNGSPGTSNPLCPSCQRPRSPTTVRSRLRFSFPAATTLFPKIKNSMQGGVRRRRQRLHTIGGEVAGEAMVPRPRGRGGLDLPPHRLDGGMEAERRPQADAAGDEAAISPTHARDRAGDWALATRPRRASAIRRGRRPPGREVVGSAGRPGSPVEPEEMNGPGGFLATSAATRLAHPQSAATGAVAAPSGGSAEASRASQLALAGRTIQPAVAGSTARPPSPAGDAH